MKRIILVIGFIGVAVTSSVAQVYSDKVAGKKNEALRDSLKEMEYPYILPIWGEKATKKGFNLPYSAGLSVQYFWQQSDLVLDNLLVGFNGGTMYNLDEIVQFNKAKATAYATTIRPDVWLFPFLNVYGILGKASASTDVGFGIYGPDPNNPGARKEYLNTETKIEFNTTTFGFGMTPTIGVAGCFLALDMNMAWTDVPQLAKPARSFIFGPRLGKTFMLNREKERAIAIWTGGFRVSLKSETSGSIPLSDAIDMNTIDAKVANAYTQIGEAQEGVNTWWAGLTAAEKINPVNIAAYVKDNAALALAGNVVAGLDQAATNAANSTVQYSMDKRPKDKWNFIVGGQYQLNKHLMFRGEYGFLASRSQYIVGIQYRFRL